MNTTKTLATIPVAPDLSIFDPVYLGVDEFGHPVYIELIDHNMLVGGEPGAGKSTLLHCVAGHAALSLDTRLCLLDAKQVELGMYRDIADEFVADDLDHANLLLERVLRVVRNRYAWLTAQKRQKITRDDGLNGLVILIDELAMYSSIFGSKDQQETFSRLLKGIVALGRACAVTVIAATQRPSGADNPPIIPASLRDIFGYRVAGRCTTDSSSDLILGHGWAQRGYDASSIREDQRGVVYLLAETGTPRLIKSPWQTSNEILSLVDYATWIRRPTHTGDTDEPGNATSNDAGAVAA